MTERQPKHKGTIITLGVLVAFIATIFLINGWRGSHMAEVEYFVENDLPIVAGGVPIWVDSLALVPSLKHRHDCKIYPGVAILYDPSTIFSIPFDEACVSYFTGRVEWISLILNSERAKEDMGQLLSEIHQMYGTDISRDGYSKYVLKNRNQRVTMTLSRSKKKINLLIKATPDVW